ncbi:hypothetical protein [Rhizobium ruizarguesonis]|uniref:hypothetical protein n=1 Tax=Rhizobium ruizarguesonis TaxID=2081791 RepID=UPI001FEEFB37|nr:hypothetical protein [Rhizobium ruizarguesonis]
MTENVVSFEEKRLERLDDTVFGSTAEEYRIAAIGSQIEFAKRELETVQAYIDFAYAGTITVTMNDCGEPPHSSRSHTLAASCQTTNRSCSTGLPSLSMSRKYSAHRPMTKEIEYHVATSAGYIRPYRRRRDHLEDTLDFRSTLLQASSISSLAIFGKVADGFYWEAK